jgi:two-component system, LuxR family, sensor kinase FixL
MSGTGGRTLSLTVRADGRQAHFAVRDQGSGIAPEMIDQIFEPFVTTKADGLGLGLSISRTIITAHGGRLWAENNVDGGATVHCLVPLDETAHSDAAKRCPEEGATASAGVLPGR